MASPVALIEALLPVRVASASAQRLSWQQRLLWAALSMVLAACYVLIPWESVSGQGFPDRDNYLAAIDALVAGGGRPFDFSSIDALALLMNEYLWRQLMLIIGNYFEDPRSGLVVVSFVTVALMTGLLIRRAGPGYVFVFLLAPLSVDLFISQTRSALAVTLFMLALPCRSVLVRSLLFAVAFMVHSFVAVLVAVYVMNAVLLASHLSHRTKLLLAVFGGVVLSAGFSFLGQGILEAVGDRRADQGAMSPASLPFAAWWILLLGLLALSADLPDRRVRAQHVLFAVVLVSMFVFTTLFGIGGVRFLSLALPFVFVACTSIRDPTVRHSAVLGTICFNLMHLYLWTS